MRPAHGLDGAPGSFVDLVGAAGVGVRAARSVADELIDRHAEPHRRYHSVEHLGEVLGAAEALLPWAGAADPLAVRLALWFHDAVYDPAADAGVNEAASASLARERLASLGLAAEVVDEVQRLVLVTAGHAVEGDDPSGAVVVDADLAILASPPDRYERYVADVRAEYGHVPDSRWRIGRTKVLDRFLAADRLFHVDLPDDGRQARATLNLRREREALGVADPPHHRG